VRQRVENATREEGTAVATAALVWRLQIIAVIGAVLVSSLACGSSPTSSPPAPPSSPPAPSAVAPAPAPAVAAQPTTCAADADCNFAEGVEPARCAVGPAPAAGKQPTKPDGVCVCLAGGCALRPEGARISEQACGNEMDDCELDVPTARCEPGITPSDSPRSSYGPSCRCDYSDQRCHLRWFDPIPFQTTDDCWASDEPVPHAIPRPKRLRGREFRACKDGEHVPACVDGTCALNSYSC